MMKPTMRTWVERKEAHRDDNRERLLELLIVSEVREEGLREEIYRLRLMEATPLPSRWIGGRGDCLHADVALSPINPDRIIQCNSCGALCPYTGGPLRWIEPAVEFARAHAERREHIAVAILAGYAAAYPHAIDAKEHVRCALIRADTLIRELDGQDALSDSGFPFKPYKPK